MKAALHGTDMPYFFWTLSGLAASIFAPPLAPYHIARNAMGRIFFLSGRWSTWPRSQQCLFVDAYGRETVPYRPRLRWNTIIPKANTLVGIKNAAQYPTSFSIKVVAIPESAPAFTHLQESVSARYQREEKPDGPIIDVEDVLHRCLPIDNDFLSRLCVLDRIRLVRALIS